MIYQRQMFVYRCVQHAKGDEGETSQGKHRQQQLKNIAGPKEYRMGEKQRKPGDPNARVEGGRL